MKGQVEEARDITLQQIITLTKILLLPNLQDSQHPKHLLKLLKKKPKSSQRNSHFTVSWKNKTSLDVAQTQTSQPSADLTFKVLNNLKSTSYLWLKVNLWGFKIMCHYCNKCHFKRDKLQVATFTVPQWTSFINFLKATAFVWINNHW